MSLGNLLAREGGSGGVGAVDIRGWGGGGVVQNRESSDFRSLEVGRYVNLKFEYLFEEIYA